MKSFKNLLGEVAQPKSEEEKRFKELHKVEVIDYVIPQPHIFKGDVVAEPRLADDGSDTNYDQSYLGKAQNQDSAIEMAPTAVTESESLKLDGRRKEFKEKLRSLLYKKEQEVAKKLAVEETELVEQPAEEVPMMLKQLGFIQYAADHMADYVSSGIDPEEWYQNKLSAVHSAVKSLYAYAQGEMQVRQQSSLAAGYYGESTMKDAEDESALEEAKTGLATGQSTVDYENSIQKLMKTLEKDPKNKGKSGNELRKLATSKLTGHKLKEYRSSTPMRDKFGPVNPKLKDKKQKKDKKDTKKEETDLEEVKVPANYAQMMMKKKRKEFKKSQSAGDKKDKKQKKESEVDEDAAAFIFAAAAAKKEGKKKFKFQGKEYPVTIKTKIESSDSKEEDAGEFNFAAAAAKKAGKKTFKFGGKEYPVTIKTKIESAPDASLETDDLDEVLTTAQRRKKAQLMKKLAPKIARKKAMNAKKMASPDKLKDRAQKAALGQIKTKIAGGKDVGELGYAARVAIDKKVKAVPKTKINSLMKKLLPGIKAKEKQRLKTMKGEGIETTSPSKTPLEEKFKPGSIQLKNGDKVKLSKEDAGLLSSMFKDMNSSNRKAMEKVLLADKVGFEEIIGFAREAL